LKSTTIKDGQKFCIKHDVKLGRIWLQRCKKTENKWQEERSVDGEDHLEYSFRQKRIKLSKFVILKCSNKQNFSP
jgi:hypothetical protein